MLQRAGTGRRPGGALHRRGRAEPARNRPKDGLACGPVALPAYPPAKKLTKI